MAKNEKRTLNVILDELNKVVDAYNELDVSDPKRADLAKQSNELTKEYNELSLLTVYSTCAATELPVKALVETFNYDTVSTKDASHREVDEEGCARLKFTRSINQTKKALVLVKFLEWAAEANKKVTATQDWKVKMLDVKAVVREEWKKFHKSDKDSTSISVKKMKAAVQDMFDSLIFIPTEKGENSVVAKGGIVRSMFQFSSMADTSAEKNTTIGTVLPDRIWNIILMKSLLAAVEGKQLTVNFEEEVTDDTKAEENPEVK